MVLQAVAETEAEDGRGSHPRPTGPQAACGVRQWECGNRHDLLQTRQTVLVTFKTSRADQSTGEWFSWLSQKMVQVQKVSLRRLVDAQLPVFSRLLGVAECAMQLGGTSPLQEHKQFPKLHCVNR